MKELASRLTRVVSRTSLPEITFIASPIIGRYLLNSDFQYPSEIIIPIIFFGTLATIAFYSYKFILRSWFAARAATLPFIYLLYTFSFLPKWLLDSGAVLPQQLDSAFVRAMFSVVLIGVICGAFGYIIKLLIQKVSFVRNLQPHRVVLFALLFIFSIQVVKMCSKLVLFHDQKGYSYPAPNYSRDLDAQVTKPDIYYFVFDRYGSNATLQKEYNYDNSDVTDYLSTQGFVTNTDAFANYPFTMSSISSTMAMEYHTGIAKLFSSDKLQTAFPYRSILNDPPVAQVLRENGYIYNQVSSWWDFTRVGINAEEHPTQSFRLRAFGKNFYLSDLTRDILNKSIMKPLLKRGMTVGSTIIIKYDNDGNPRENFYAQKAAIKTIASSTHAAPQFTFAHVLIPHTPYVFNADGSSTTYDDGPNDNGADETVKYINSVKFINSQIKEMMGYIRAKSPNAAIIIQADEGPYPKQFRFELTPDHYYDPADLPLDKAKQKFSVLASYYMPGVDASTVRKNITSSVNPFRFVLRNYLGYNIDMLPVCNFSTGDKFTVYSYKNETPKLQANPSPACDNI